MYFTLLLTTVLWQKFKYYLSNLLSPSAWKNWLLTITILNEWMNTTGEVKKEVEYDNDELLTLIMTYLAACWATYKKKTFHVPSGTNKVGAEIDFHLLVSLGTRPGRVLYTHARNCLTYFNTGKVVLHHFIPFSSSLLIVGLSRSVNLFFAELLNSDRLLIA